MNEDNRLKDKLAQFYERVPSPPQGLQPGRARFLAQAARLSKKSPAAVVSHVQKTPRRRKMRLALVYKVIAAILAVVVGTAALGGGVAYAASDSLPGEPLYPVKLGVEDARLAWTANPAGRAQLGMAFATERVREMQQLAQQGKPVPGSVPTRMAQHMEQTMAQVAKAKPEDVPGLLKQVMAQTRAQEQFLEQLEATGGPGSQAAVQYALQAARRAHETASAAQGDPNRYQSEYQYRYQGEPMPQPQQQQKQKHGEDAGQNTGQGEGGNQNRVQKQEQTNAATPTITPQQNREQNGNGAAGAPSQNQHQEQNNTVTPTVTPVQNQHQEQNNTVTPVQNQHQEQNNTVTPTVTPAQNQHQEQNNTVTPTMTPQANQEQNGNGPTPTPQGQPSNGGAGK